MHTLITHIATILKLSKESPAEFTDKRDREVEELMEKRKALKNKSDDKSKGELDEIETKLNEKCAEKNYQTIMEEISNIKVEEGGIHSGSLWKLKKKLNPRCRDPPTAMMDPDNNLLTNPEEIEKLALKTYKGRLPNRKRKEELLNIQKDKEDLCQLRLEAAGKNKTQYGIWNNWILF